MKCRAQKAYNLDSGMNPFEMDDILSHLMTFVRPPDLLNCRLVNHQWKQATRNQMRKKMQVKLNSDTRSRRDAPSLNSRREEEAMLLKLFPDTEHSYEDPPSKQFLQSFSISSFDMLTSGFVTKIGVFMKTLKYEGDEINESILAFIWIASLCPNLKELDFCIRSCHEYYRKDLAEMRDPHLTLLKASTGYQINAKLFKLRSLTIRFEFKLKKSASTSPFTELVKNMLTCFPNLEELHLPGIPLANEVPNLQIELCTAAHLIHLRSLTVGHEISATSFLQLIQSNFKLKTLKVNLPLSASLVAAIGVVQPFLQHIQFDIRGFVYDELESIDQLLRQSFLLQELKTIQVQDSRIPSREDRLTIKINQFTRTARVERVGCYDRILSYGSKLQFLETAPMHMSTITSLSLGFMATWATNTLDLFSQSTALRSLELVLSMPKTFNKIWTFTQLKKLVVHVHCKFHSSVELQSRITGIRSPTSPIRRVGPKSLDNRPQSATISTTALASPEIGLTSPTKELMGIRQLKDLESLEIKDLTPEFGGQQKHFFLTAKSFRECFMQMETLTSLKVPYKGPECWIRSLKAFRPGIYFENTYGKQVQ